MSVAGRDSGLGAQSRGSGQIDWGLFLLVVVASQGYFGLIPAGEQWRKNLILIAVGAILLVLIVRERTRLFNSVYFPPLVLFMVAWYLLANLLSESPGYGPVFLVGMIAYVFLRQSAAKPTLQTFALATTVALVPSMVGLFIPLGMPVFMHAGSSGGYAGYFPWNSFSGVCAAVAIVSIATLLFGAGFMWWHLPAVALALFALVVAKSATSTLACVAALGSLLMLTVMRRVDARHRLLVFVVAGMGVFVAALGLTGTSIFSVIADVTGRDEDFSRRTDIWQYGLKGISESPYWGYGSTYWESQRGNSAQNGFLEFALYAGIPAAIAFIGLVIVSGYRLIVALSPLLPFWTLGVVWSLAISQLAYPSVSSLPLWIAIASTARIAVGPAPYTATTRQRGALEARRNQRGNAVHAVVPFRN
ncbi:O-antigen ligase family protein [Mycolicibacterium hippocampi]|uniref:O-antigen ligase family protein n=1 Tax=Mycolicibacterium hippocampi TaxID=659824 RepID=UPI0013D4B370|nr:O-antigen ligase family protein [Mycolicibacterium hippocampi]